MGQALQQADARAGEHRKKFREYLRMLSCQALQVADPPIGSHSANGTSTAGADGKWSLNATP
jgi:hypothetical protein